MEGLCRIYSVHKNSCYGRGKVVNKGNIEAILEDTEIVEGQFEMADEEFLEHDFIWSKKNGKIFD